MASAKRKPEHCAQASVRSRRKAVVKPMLIESGDLGGSHACAWRAEAIRTWKVLDPLSQECKKIPAMSWKKFFFGVSDPSRERIFGVTVSAIAAAVAAYGFWADFVPSAIVQRFSFYASVVVGLVSTFLLFRRLGTSGVLGPRSKSLLVRWSFIFVTPVFLIYVSWAALGHGIPAIYTVVAGTPYKEEIQLVKKRGGGRRTCDYRLEGGPFREALPSYICIDQFAFDSLPESTGMFQLFGRKSMLGILYENIRRI